MISLKDARIVAASLSFIALWVGFVVGGIFVKWYEGDGHRVDPKYSVGSCPYCETSLSEHDIDRIVGLPLPWGDSVGELPSFEPGELTFFPLTGEDARLMPPAPPSSSVDRAGWAWQWQINGRGELLYRRVGKSHFKVNIVEKGNRK